MTKILGIGGLLLLMSLFVSCKNTYEKAGDKQLKAGNYQKALQQYSKVKDQGSADFKDHYTMAYIGTMGEAYVKGADMSKLILYIEKVDELMKEQLKPKTQSFYCETVISIGGQLVDQGDFASEEMGFTLIKGTDRIGKACEGSKPKIDSIRAGYVSKYLKKAEEHYLNCKKGEVTEGIVADYLLNQLTFFAEATPEVNELWSKVRRANLSTFLLYTYESAVENPISAINKYSVLLAVTKLTRAKKATIVQVQVYNGSNANVTPKAGDFILVDKEGKEYKPFRKRGSFKKPKKLEGGDRSKVGELSFKVNKGVKLDYLQYKSKAGVSKKFLP